MRDLLAIDLLLLVTSNEVDFQRPTLWHDNRRWRWKFVELKIWTINGVYNEFEKNGQLWEFVHYHQLVKACDLPSPSVEVKLRRMSNAFKKNDWFVRKGYIVPPKSV